MVVSMCLCPYASLIISSGHPASRLMFPKYLRNIWGVVWMPVFFSIRSSIASQKEMLAQRVHAIVEFAGGTVTERGKYPGWQYERDSQFRDMVLEAYHDLTGKEGVVEATHGGLECGLLIEKIPGLDAISMGPELHDVHSVRERLSVPSTERMYELLCEALKRSK